MGLLTMETIDATVRVLPTAPLPPKAVRLEGADKARIERVAIEAHYLDRENKRVLERVQVLKEDLATLQIEMQRKGRALDSEIRSLSDQQVVVQTRTTMAFQALEDMKSSILGAAGVPSSDHANYVPEFGPNFTVVQLKLKEAAPAKES